MSGVLAGGIFIVVLDCWEISNNLKLLSGILFAALLSRFVFYIRINGIVQAVLLTAVGTLASRLLSSALLMISMGNNFLVQFAAKSELQLEERIFSQTLLFFLAILATELFRQQEENLGWREIVLLLIQLSTCIGTLILIMELSGYRKGELRIPPGYVCFMSLGCIFIYFISYYIISQYFKTKREQLELVEQQAASYGEDFRSGSAVTDALLYETKKRQKKPGFLLKQIFSRIVSEEFRILFCVRFWEMRWITHGRQ